MPRSVLDAPGVADPSVAPRERRSSRDSTTPPRPWTHVARASGALDDERRELDGRSRVTVVGAAVERDP